MTLQVLGDGSFTWWHHRNLRECQQTRFIYPRQRRKYLKTVGRDDRKLLSSTIRNLSCSYRNAEIYISSTWNDRLLTFQARSVMSSSEKPRSKMRSGERLSHGRITSWRLSCRRAVVEGPTKEELAVERPAVERQAIIGRADKHEVRRFRSEVSKRTSIILTGSPFRGLQPKTSSYL